MAPEITPRAILEAVSARGATSKALPCVVANSALAICEALDRIVEALDRQHPPK